MSTPDSDAPVTPPAQPDNTAEAGNETKPSKVAALAGDAAKVAIETAKGAVGGGGLQGAAIGAAKGIIQTKSGRRIIIYGFIGTLVPFIALVLVVVMSLSATAGVSNIQAGYNSMAQAAVVKDITDKAILGTIQDAAQATGVRWEALVSIYKNEQGQSEGTGPFHILVDKTNGGISADDAGKLDTAAKYVGHALAQAGSDTYDTLTNKALEAGALDHSADDGTVTRTTGGDDLSKASAAAVKTQYVAAFKKLPIAGNPEISDAIFELAHQWALGQQGGGSCMPDNSSVTIGGPTSVTLNDSQKQHVQQIINTVAARGLSEQAAIIALSTAAQESTFMMYANSKIPESMALPHDAVGSDGWSVGLFQQQVHGNDYSWGTVPDAMDPTRSTNMFLDALLRVPGWQSMPVTVAAQTVQGSAFPSAYAKWVDQATQLVKDLKPTGGSSYGSPSEPLPSDGASASPSPTASSSNSSSGCGSSGLPGVATSGKDDYPWKNPVGDCAWCSGSADPGTDPWGSYKRECVSFVAWRMNQQMGWKEGEPYPFSIQKLGLDFLGDAVTWGPQLTKAGFKVDHTPAKGSIAWWGANGAAGIGPEGHVGVVLDVQGQTVTVEQYNVTDAEHPTGHAYVVTQIPIDNPTGYIHVADTK